MHRHRSALCLALALLAAGWWLPTSLATSQGAATAISSPAAAWRAILAKARDLGPSTAGVVNVLARLRAPGDEASLRQWASQRDVGVTWSAGASTAVLSAPPSVLGRALDVRIDDYRLAGFARFYASRVDPAVPHALQHQLIALGRISSLGQVHAGAVSKLLGPRSVVVGLGPAGFVDDYDARPLWDRGDFGKGETIVFFEVDGYSQQDLETYATQFGLPAYADPLPHIGALNLKPEGESDMDLEVAHAIAPDATLVYVNLDAFGGTNASPAAEFERAFSEVARRYPGAIWSISLGQCEDLFSATDLDAVNGAVAQAERQGTTAFAASGDSGGLECLGVHQSVPSIPAEGISFPGDLPNITTVGGTTLELTTSGAYSSDTTWTEPLLSQGSTGGRSSIFTMPSWQAGPGVISSYSSGATCSAPAGSYCREVPDVAADANPTTGAAIRFGGKWLTNGGTSLATPEWAAFTALTDDYLRSLGERPLGFVNPLLYQLARDTPRYVPFHDVTLGANDFYPATSGYDMVTGLGTPNVWNLAQDLASLVKRQ